MAGAFFEATLPDGACGAVVGVPQGSILGLGPWHVLLGKGKAVVGKAVQEGALLLAGPRGNAR
jgi:hypothetical protein